MCVGATWTYDEIYSEGKAKVANYKKWSIARYGTIGDPAHGKRDVNAFLQVRPSALDFSHKWISVVGNPPPAGGSRSRWRARIAGTSWRWTT
jgi:hypothetical protein